MSTPTAFTGEVFGYYLNPSNNVRALITQSSITGIDAQNLDDQLNSEAQEFFDKDACNEVFAHRFANDGDFTFRQYAYNENHQFTIIKEIAVI